MSKTDGIWIWAKDRAALIPAFKAAVEMIGKVGTVEVRIFPIKLTRSVAQNKLMWVWFEFIATHTECGEDKNNLHDWYVNEYIPKYEVDILGDRFEIQKGTSKLSPDEFSHFLKEVEKHANSFHCIELPQPSELMAAAQLKWYKEINNGK